VKRLQYRIATAAEFTAKDPVLARDEAPRAMHNELGDVIEAMQAELGLNPSGQAATVVARLDDLTVVNVKDYGAAGNDTTDDTVPIAKPTVSGSRGSNAALTSLCTALANLGLITNSTS